MAMIGIHWWINLPNAIAYYISMNISVAVWTPCSEIVCVCSALGSMCTTCSGEESPVKHERSVNERQRTAV